MAGVIAALAVSLYIGPVALGAEAFPTRAITMVVPFGAGGGFDRLARQLAAGLEKDLNVAVVVRNEPGAGGRRGSITLFKSQPDGYTIGFAHLLPFLVDDILLERTPAIAIDEFEPLLQIAHSRQFVYVARNSPVASLESMKSLGKAVRFSGTGIGAVSWITATALGAAAQFPVSFVLGYESLPQAALAVARGDADAGVGASHHFQGVSEDVRPLFIMADQRDSRAPQVPSISELGYPQLAVLGTPRVLFAPPGTPQERQQVIRAALQRIVQESEFVTWMDETGNYLAPAGPAQVRQTIDDYADIYRQLKPAYQRARKDTDDAS